jgi:hypothetical protein
VSSSFQPVPDDDRDVDDALEVVRLTLPDALGFLDDPDAYGDQVGPELLRKLIVGRCEVLDKPDPEAADEVDSFDGVAGFKTVGLGCGSAARSND